MKLKALILVCMCGLLIGGVVTGCDDGIIGINSKTRRLIERAIDELSMQPGRWDQVLANLTSNVGGEMRETIRTLRSEMQDLTREVTETAGIEGRCTVEFVGQRVQRALQQILDNNDPRGKYELAPWICHLRPEEFTVDSIGRPPAVPIKVTGFGFTPQNVSSAQIAVVDQNGNVILPIHMVPNHVSAYRMTINIQGIQFPLTPRNKLRVAWSGDSYYTEASIIVPEAPVPTPTPAPRSIARSEYVDGGTQESGMHACPKGYAIAGVHIDQNKFLCRRVMPEGEENYVQTVVDSGTQRHGMHACPVGTYLRGLHGGQNRFLCSWDSRRPQKEYQQEFEDSGTQSHGMHVCPRDGTPTYLTGIHIDQNRFLCGVHYREDTR